jgi:hypothetical protein
MSDELPNLSLLIKLLKLTASQNDAEALMAIRKANEQLSKFGGDWERLLRSHVTIIGADPFAEIATPPASMRAAPRAQPSPRHTARPFRNPTNPSPAQTAPGPSPQATQTPQPWTVPSPRPNRYAGHCFMCGYNVAIGDGITRYIGTQSSGKWEVFCGSCDTMVNAGTAIPKRRATKRTSLKDALSQI